MFSFLKKQPKPTYNHFVWKNKAAKYQQLFKFASEGMMKNTIFIYFFLETGQEARYVFKQSGMDVRQTSSLEETLSSASSGSFLLPASGVLNAKEKSWHPRNDIKVILLEQYPLFQTEEALLLKLNALLSSIIPEIHTEIDAPLFKYFGSERMESLLNSLGFKADESLSHPMIKKAIQRAQVKLSEKISSEKPANSQEEWFKSNLGRLPG